MKVGKPQSKRVSVRLRHKIQKHSANKQRKDRKEAKKNPQWRSRLKKDPGIPNLFPYKDKILAEIEDNKRTKEEEKERRRQVAKAQREGGAEDTTPGVVIDEELEESRDDDDDDDDEMDDREDVNPMAALVASASHRAQAYTRQDDGVGDDDQDDAEDEVEVTSKPVANTAESAKKKLPQQVIDDPVKPVNRLLARLQKTPDGIQQLLEFYQLPPLVTAGSDVTTRFLVDVARKRGRLSRGGVPNLHAAALTVLNDLQEQRLKLPALQQSKPSAATSKSEVQVVSRLAEPFSIEGLFSQGPATAGAMDLGA